MFSNRRPHTPSVALPFPVRRPALALLGATLLTLACALFGAAPAFAGYVYSGVPGASCNVDKSLAGSWEYRGRRLVNTGTDRWDVLVATCAVSFFAPGVRPLEYRIYLNDPERRSAWCQVYSASGRHLRTEDANWAHPAPVAGTTEGIGWSVGLVEVTFQCLLHPRASIDRIELLWWKP